MEENITRSITKKKTDHSPERFFSFNTISLLRVRLIRKMNDMRYFFNSLLRYIQGKFTGKLFPDEFVL